MRTDLERSLPSLVKARPLWSSSVMTALQIASKSKKISDFAISIYDEHSLLSFRLSDPKLKNLSSPAGVSGMQIL